MNKRKYNFRSSTNKNTDKKRTGVREHDDDERREQEVDKVLTKDKSTGKKIKTSSTNQYEVQDDDDDGEYEVLSQGSSMMSPQGNSNLNLSFFNKLYYVS